MICLECRAVVLDFHTDLHTVAQDLCLFHSDEKEMIEKNCELIVECCSLTVQVQRNQVCLTEDLVLLLFVSPCNC